MTYPGPHTFPSDHTYPGQRFVAERDRQHPSPDGNAFNPRLVAEKRTQHMRVDATDEWTDVPVAAVMWPSVGEVIELGPWSMSIDEARELASTLVALTNLIDTNHPDSLIRETKGDL